MQKLAPTLTVVGTALLVAILVVLTAGWTTPGEAALAGDRTVDSVGTWWFQWWVDRTLDEGGDLAWTDLLFFPWGKDIFRHTGGNLLDAILLVPVRRALGPDAAWNLSYGAIVFTNGAVAGAWVRRLGASTWATAAATVLAALHPYALFELGEGRPTQAILAPMVAALALAWAAMHEADNRRGLLLAAASGACLALVGWLYWFGAGFAAMAVTLLALGRPLAARLTRLLVAGLVASVLTAPAVIPLAQALLAGKIPGILPVDQWVAGDFSLVNSAEDPVVMATLGHEWMAGYLQDGRWRAVAPALGLLALLAAAPAFLRGWQWAAVAGVALVLAVGPLPAGFDNPVYLALTVLFPPMQRLYWPVRALALLLPLAVLGLAELDRRLRDRRAWLLLLVPLGIAGESAYRGQLPLDAWSAEVAPAYACLAGQEGALIELPYGVDHDQLLHQTVHGLPMFGGMNERSHSLVPAEHQQAREANSWLAAVVTAGANPRDRSTWTDEDKQAIHVLGYRWITMRVDAMTDEGMRQGAWERRRAADLRLRDLAGNPVYVDEWTRIYAPWGDQLDCEPGQAGGAGPGEAGAR